MKERRFFAHFDFENEFLQPKLETDKMKTLDFLGKLYTKVLTAINWCSIFLDTDTFIPIHPGETNAPETRTAAEATREEPNRGRDLVVYARRKGFAEKGLRVVRNNAKPFSMDCGNHHRRGRTDNQIPQKTKMSVNWTIEPRSVNALSCNQNTLNYSPSRRKFKCSPI